MTATDLNLHGRVAVARVLDDLRAALAQYGRGGIPAGTVEAFLKALAAQSRASERIAPREAAALRGIGAIVELDLLRAESSLSSRGHERWLSDAVAVLDRGRSAIYG